MNERGGVFNPGKGVVTVTGPDAQDFLHRLTTQHVKSMENGHILHCALLQPNSMVLSLFEIARIEDKFFLITDEAFTQPTADYLEKMHFAENLEIENASMKWTVWALSTEKEGEGAVEALRAKVPTHFFLLVPQGKLPSSYFIFPSEKEGALKETLAAKGVSLLGTDLWTTLRAEAGYFEPGREITEKNLILEAPAELYVHRNKGCYPGQEIVERIFTYGNVAKRLMGAIISAGQDLAPGDSLEADGKTGGTVVSVIPLLDGKRQRVYAMIKKPFYVHGKEMTVRGHSIQINDLPGTFHIDEKTPS